MEFWGIEVLAGQPIQADPGVNYVIHLSQATLGESKNKAESVPLYVNADGKKLVLGTLSHQNCPQLSFDLVFDKEFELSHNWKDGSVYFLGYKTYVPEEGDDFDVSSDDESSEEELPLADAENGKAKTDVKTSKDNAAGKPEAVKQAVKIAEPIKKTEDEDNDDSEGESGSDDEDDSEDEDESAESMEGSSDDEDEVTPKKVESSKKRPAETATPAYKKAKSAVSPQKTDGKKGGHTATPHPAKQAGKNSAKTPKSFGGGPGSNKKAKHGGK